VEAQLGEIQADASAAFNPDRLELLKGAIETDERWRWNLLVRPITPTAATGLTH
jgi:hypothetical protein